MPSSVKPVPIKENMDGRTLLSIQYHCNISNKEHTGVSDIHMISVQTKGKLISIYIVRKCINYLPHSTGCSTR